MMYPKRKNTIFISKVSKQYLFSIVLVRYMHIHHHIHIILDAIAQGTLQNSFLTSSNGDPSNLQKQYAQSWAQYRNADNNQLEYAKGFANRGDFEQVLTGYSKEIAGPSLATMLLPAHDTRHATKTSTPQFLQQNTNYGLNTPPAVAPESTEQALQKDAYQTTSETVIPIPPEALQGNQDGDESNWKTINYTTFITPPSDQPAKQQPATAVDPVPSYQYAAQQNTQAASVVQPSTYPVSVAKQNTPQTVEVSTPSPVVNNYISEVPSQSRPPVYVSTKGQADIAQTERYPNSYPEPKNFGYNFLMARKKAELQKQQNLKAMKAKEPYVRYPKPDALTYKNGTKIDLPGINWPKQPMKIKFSYEPKEQGMEMFVCFSA